MEIEQPTHESASKTAEELFLDTFQGDYDDDAPWTAVTELRRRNSPDVFKQAINYSRSRVPLERARALDVLAQVDADKPPAERLHLDESVAIAEESLRD